MIATGKAADFVVFDSYTVDAGEKMMLNDLPGGERRFVQRAEGIHHVVVNGEIVLTQGEHSGALPGQMLRAG